MVAPLLLLLAAVSVRGLTFAILALATTAPAAITNVAWYRLGENAQTPANGLTYNLRAGTTPGGADLVAPMAGTDGQRRLPQFGNAQQNSSRSISFPIGTPIYWSVQAVDSAFAGSSFAPEESFRVLQAPPLLALVNVTNVMPGDVNGDGILDDSELNNVLSNYFPYRHVPWRQNPTRSSNSWSRRPAKRERDQA
jgi:hypothetical protein